MIWVVINCLSVFVVVLSVVRSMSTVVKSRWISMVLKCRSYSKAILVGPRGPRRLPSSMWNSGSLRYACPARTFSIQFFCHIVGALW